MMLLDSQLYDHILFTIRSSWMCERVSDHSLNVILGLVHAKGEEKGEREPASAAAHIVSRVKKRTV
jgi:hypothetical protein